MKRYLAFALILSLVLGVFSLAGASEPGKLLIWADDTRVRALQDVADEFAAAYGIPVEVQEMAFGDIREQLAVAGPAGRGPDVLVGAHDWLGELVANGLIEPIQLGNKASEFVEVTLESFTWGEDLYGVPYAMEAVGLIYNKDLVPEPPTTFEKLREAAQNVRDQDQYGFLIPQPDPYHTFPFMSAKGGYIFGTHDDGTLNPLDVGLHHEGAVEGLELLYGLIQDGLMPGMIDYTTMMSLFTSGRLGMMVTGPWALHDVRSAEMNYGFAKLPSIDGHTSKPFVGVQGFMISSFSENKMLAQAFLTEYVASKDVMLQIFELDNRPPAYMPAADVAAEDADIAGVLESAANGIPMPAIPEMAAVWQAYSDALELVFTGELGAKEALSIASTDILIAIESQ